MGDLMWVLTRKGCFSAAEDADDDTMVYVRTHTLVDAENFLAALAKKDQGEGGVIHTIAGCYTYRVHATKAGWARFCAAEAAAVDYPSFQKAVAAENPTRALSYRQAWGRFSSITLREDALHGYPKDERKGEDWPTGSALLTNPDRCMCCGDVLRAGKLATTSPKVPGFYFCSPEHLFRYAAVHS